MSTQPEFDETTPTTEHEESTELTELDEIDHLTRDEADTQISAEERDDLPVSPPEHQPRSAGDDGGDASPVEESIEQRIMQEEPDPDSAYGAPDDEGALGRPAPIGGDDPDAIDAKDDVLGSLNQEPGTA